MRLTSFSIGLAAISWLVMVTGTAQASEETQLVQSINAFRSQAQPCANIVSQELPPLTDDPRLNLPATGSVDLQQVLARASYPMVTVQAISLSLVQERLLRLSEPTLAQRWSMTQVLECT